jgi:hypothetical protein
MNQCGILDVEETQPVGSFALYLALTREFQVVESAPCA